MSGNQCSTNRKTTGSLNAGWGEADITPDDRKVELKGQYYQRLATGIFSRLKATVLILEQDGDISAMVSLDVLGLPSDFRRTLQERIAAEVPGLAPERVLVNAIHTHNAPGPPAKVAGRWRIPPVCGSAPLRPCRQDAQPSRVFPCPPK